MDGISTALAAIDALDATRTDLIGMAKICQAMECTTGDEIWPALYELMMLCAKRTEEPAKNLTKLVNERPDEVPRTLEELTRFELTPVYNPEDFAGKDLEEVLTRR